MATRTGIYYFCKVMNRFVRWARAHLCIAVVSLSALGASSDSATILAKVPQSSAAERSTNDAIPWKGEPNAGSWIWERQFDSLQKVSSIFQINGDHPFVLTNAPWVYAWFGTEDGKLWFKLPEASIVHEHRLVRMHKLSHPRLLKGLRLRITQSKGAYPALRKIEILENDQPRTQWALVVNATESTTLPGHGDQFVPLIHSADPNLVVQQVNLEDFNPAFIKQNPGPLCAFMSGTFVDWCEVDRERWRGTEEILKQRQLPIWASCGGAQGLAILATTGVDKPWDCPHCREPGHPFLPVYSHIGDTSAKPCGDYSGCIFERGPYSIAKVGSDPVFAGLPHEFKAIESHCGQINFPPKGWKVVATGGPGTLTKMQCVKLRGNPIYAAQFHIEMGGEPETSAAIMKNFLRLSEKVHSNY
jgi:hypothetical protein